MNLFLIVIALALIGCTPSHRPSVSKRKRLVATAILPAVIPPQTNHVPKVAVMLAWNASPSIGVTGYKVIYGSASQLYTTTNDVGLTTNAVMAGFPVGSTNYFAVLAYNALGMQSSNSAEAMWIALPRPLTNLIFLTFSGLSNGQWIAFGQSQSVTNPQGSLLLRSLARNGSVSVQGLTGTGVTWQPVAAFGSVTGNYAAYRVAINLRKQ